MYICTVTAELHVAQMRQTRFHYMYIVQRSATICTAHAAHTNLIYHCLLPSQYMYRESVYMYNVQCITCTRSKAPNKDYTYINCNQFKEFRHEFSQ